MIDRKHRLAGEITMLSAEVRRLRARGQPSGAVERRLEQARNEHFRTRLEIDQAEPDS